MRRALRTPLALVFGAMLVTGAMLGGPGVQQAAADDWVDSCHVGPIVVVAPAGTLCPDANTDDLEQADALETKKEIYNQASTQNQNNEILQDSYSNYLEDTQTIARMEGKNAYIRALNNGSSEAIARNTAIEAVSDYYSVKQKQLIASWNVTTTVANSSNQTAANTSGMSSDYVSITTSESNGYPYPENYNWSGSVSLVNGSSAQTVQFGFESDSAAWWASVDGYGCEGACVDQSNWTINVQPPTSDHENLTLVKASNFHDLWSEIPAQNDVVQSELDTFINATYEEYQAGGINNSDLVDPYLGAREYAPENGTNFDAYTLRSLASLGLDTPENLSNIGRMEVLYGSQTYTGILMADSTPAGGYTVGETYNASEMNGSEFIALDDGGTQTLEGEFTLQSAETATGETVETNETIKYNTVNYNTTSTEEYQELQTQLNNLTAQINARQQTLRNSGGGGGFLPDVNFGLGGAGLPVVLIAAGAALVLLKD